MNHLKVSGITDDAGFDAMEAEWDALHAASSASVFQSFAWLRTWWRHFGECVPGHELHIVVIREGDTLAGIAPFYIQSKKLSALASTRELRFLGDGMSDYLDVILGPGGEAEVLRAIASHVGELWKQLDSIRLTDIADESMTKQVLRDELAAAGVAAVSGPCDSCPRTTLRGTWEETLAGLSGEQRRHLMKRRRQLSEAYPVGYECIEDGEMLDEAMADFVAMHQARMESSGRDGVFSNDRLERFHREACGEFHKRGWLFLSFLKLSDKRVATACSYLHKGRVYFHLSGVGMVGDAWKLSPGIVLHGYCMEEAIRRGAGVYDFLRGTEAYKYRFGAVDFPNWRIEASRVRMRVRVLGPVGSGLGRIRRSVRSCLGSSANKIS